MKTRTVLIGLALITFLASFAPLGGEGFTLHVNNKLVLEHYFIPNAVTPHLSMAVITGNDAVSISYNECGKVGTNRRLTLTDETGSTVKAWKFADEEGRVMTLRGADWVAFNKDARKTYTLTYTSKLVSTGRVLVVFDAKNVLGVARKQ